MSLNPALASNGKVVSSLPLSDGLHCRIWKSKCVLVSFSPLFWDQVKKEAHTVETPLKHGSRGGDLPSVCRSAPLSSLVPCFGALFVLLYNVLKVITFNTLPEFH